MAKQKLRINLFDAFVLFVIVAAAGLFIFSFSNKPNLGDKNVSIELKISNSDTINAILPKVITSKTVYFSGTKYPVTQTSYRVENDASGRAQYLYVTIEGKGVISEGDSTFNGQRIYVNQKVEIHADYQAQGYVMDYHYEDQ